MLRARTREYHLKTDWLSKVFEGMRGFIARSIILVRCNDIRQGRRNSLTTSRFVIKNSKHMHDGPYQQQPAYFLRS
ncbi:hypothetical protein CIHG_01685 [Coccidioides immitis H538.4]|uniref:Uncharacterized protein n=3 Tax=Coccidioides immitis TaxID=5501 RepID=A0A0J8R5T2_COCIT|nr:hypothetical protein CIRG_06014 [Coccidioides immitis RMSCC 2394]KMU80464.1 hypothetical protein CISG_02315 [Coccidioides immitis RMSCC 3703]KMU83901.1 hypothetical protein CIHG_01685 [Coccidioides immitis H538.4]